MKKLKKVSALILSLCLSAGVFVFSQADVSAEEAVATPHKYELYDYFDQYQQGTDFIATSAWSMQTKKSDSNEWKSEVSHLDTTVSDGWKYIRQNNSLSWSYTSGFGYYTKVQSDGRYMDSIAIPCNSKQYPSCVYDVAYAFTAPQAGYYNLGKANQAKVVSYDDANSFHLKSTGEKLDFGVRITLDGTTIWPTQTESFYRDGWAVFGDKDDTPDSIAIPELFDIEMQQSQVLRVEFTSITPCSNAWNERVLGMVGITYMRAAVIKEPVPSQADLPLTYDVYDYFNSLADSTTTTSPWTVSIYKNNSSQWITIDTSYYSGEYYYLHSSSVCSDNVPGIKFYRPSDYATKNYYLTFAFPYNYGNLLNTDVAYTFNTPYTGEYTYSKTSSKKVFSYDDDYYFNSRYSDDNSDIGVRITVDGETVWPTSTQSSDGWTHLNKKASQEELVQIPNLNLFLEEGQIVRTEYHDFTQLSNRWGIGTSGLPEIKLTKIEGNASTTSRDFEDLGLYLDGEGSISSCFELYKDDHLYTNNVNTLKNDEILLQAKSSVLGNGIKLALNGFELLINGENSSITAPDGSSKTIAIPNDDLYEIQYQVTSSFAANSYTGTLVSATINGVSYDKQFNNQYSDTTKGITFDNLTGDKMYIMPSRPQLVPNSGLSYDNSTRVLYVGDINDINIVKSLIQNSIRYSFVNSLKTGNTFSRIGNDNELMTYSFATKGDANADGIVDVKDLVHIKKISADIVTPTNAEIVSAKFGDKEKTYSESMIDMRKYILSK